MANLTASQQAQLKGLGIDWTKIDWTKVVAIIQLLLSIFASAPPAEMKKGFASCTDDCCAHAHASVCHSLQAADEALQCCGTPCPPAP